MCETRDDHDWGGWVIKEAGRHPVHGNYIRFERTCRKCDKRDGATDFGLKVPAFDKGYKVEERPK